MVRRATLAGCFGMDPLPFSVASTSSFRRNAPAALARGSSVASAVVS
jgi:hypothetical protein